MCRWLNLPRSSYYYKAVEPVSEMELEEKIKGIFIKRKSRYGARKIKQVLVTQGGCLKSLNLVSVYQKAAFKAHYNVKNKALVPSHLNQVFAQRQPLEVLVTDLTYVRVGARWAYVYFIIDLYNREIIGLSIG